MTIAAYAGMYADIRLPEENPTAHKYLQDMDKAMQNARKCMEAAQQRQKRYADEHRSDLSFKVDDKVLLSTEHIPLRAVGTRQLLMKWVGPFTVVKVINEVAYKVKLPDGLWIHKHFWCMSMCSHGAVHQGAWPESFTRTTCCTWVASNYASWPHR